MSDLEYKQMYQEIYGKEPEGFLWDLGMYSEFKVGDPVEGVSFTEPIRLAGLSTDEQDCYLRVLKYSYGMADRTAITMYGKQDDEIVPIGHFDLKWTPSLDEGVVITDMSTISEARSDQLPDDIQKVVAAFSGDGHSGAIEINEEFRGKGYAKLLWQLGCLVMDNEGYQEIHIGGDTTLQEGATQSFFDKLGAEPVKGRRSRLDGSEGQQSTTKKISLKLTDEIKTNVKQALKG